MDCSIDLTFDTEEVKLDTKIEPTFSLAKFGFDGILGGALAGFGGLYSWGQQMEGLNESWTTNSRKFWKEEARNPQSIFHNNERAMKGLTPKEYVLHHPYGRFGSRIKVYYPKKTTDHIQFHKIYGYGQKTGGFTSAYPTENIWEWLRSLL